MQVRWNSQADGVLKCMAAATAVNRHNMRWQSPNTQCKRAVTVTNTQDRLMTPTDNAQNAAEGCPGWAHAAAAGWWYAEGWWYAYVHGSRNNLMSVTTQVAITRHANALTQLKHAGQIERSGRCVQDAAHGPTGLQLRS
jgi:hypothetical protein